MLSVPTPHVVGSATGSCACPQCSASWDDEVTQASAWLDVGARLEGVCECGSFLEWKHAPTGRWLLTSWVPPVS